MSKDDFPASEFAARRALVRSAIAEAGLDWLIAFHPVSIHWLTGSDAKSYQAFQCLAIAAEERPLVMLTRASERPEFLDDALVDDVRIWGGGEPADPIAAFSDLAAGLALTKARIGIEVPGYYLHPHHYVRVKEVLGAALKAEPTNLIHNLKLVKSPRELDYIRKAAAIADTAMNVFIGSLAEDRMELEICGAVYQSLLSNGSGLPASTLNFVSGERAGFSHGAPTHRKLKRGDIGNVEYGATWKRYTCTIGRDFSLGRPSSRHREVFAVMRAAGEACMAAIKPGVPARVPHEAAKKVIANAGLDRYRCHTTGYGLAPGFPPSWGEPVHMFGDSNYTLEKGMVLSVEPPVFIPEERLGVRLIDNVLVTATGAELLSHIPREIIVID
jgi:Xaa-Pro dipeptidase